MRRQENKTEGRAFGPALEGNTRSTPESDTKGDPKEQRQQQRQESTKIVQKIEELLKKNWSATGLADGSPGATVESQIAMLLDHARELSAENVEGKQALEELRKERAQDTKQHMEEINKWSALRQTHEGLKKL